MMKRTSFLGVSSRRSCRSSWNRSTWNRSTIQFERNKQWPSDFSLTPALCMLSRVSYVRLFESLWTTARQAPLSMGLPRQEYWSGLPFPSPMHESEKWKWSHSVVSNSATPWTAAYQAPPSMGFSRQEYWSRVPLPSPNPSLCPNH